MKASVLINDIEKYSGKYVATKSFLDKNVISSGKNPVKVYNAAKKKGINDPVIFYIPEKDVVQIYKCR